MEISQFEQDNIRYIFKPPVEVGDKAPTSIHKLAAVALLGCEAEDSEINAAMEVFATLLNDTRDRVATFNAFLSGKHTVRGEREGPGMPAWRSAAPYRGKIPGAELSPKTSIKLQQELRDLERVRRAGVRGNDPIVY